MLLVVLNFVVPASFISRPTNQTINETETVTFMCDASGNPTPNITWFRGGQTVATGRTLSFPVFRNQSGYYLCVADNDLNVTLNASAYLEVHCKFKSVSEYLFSCTRLCRYDFIIYFIIWLCLTRTGNYRIHEFDWPKSILTAV